MAKDIQDQSWSFTATGTNDNYNSWQPNGTNYYTASAGGFGSAPMLAMFDRFKGQDDGEIINQEADVGTWRANGNFSFNNRPPVITFDGRKGVTHNDPASGQGATRYGLGIEGLDYTGAIEFYKLGVPSGKTFPGSTELETFPGVSSLKTTWHCGYGWNGSAGECDLVSLTHSGFGNFKKGGNNIEGHYVGGVGSAWEWNEWNSFLNIYIPDSIDVQGPNGVSNSYLWNSAGRYADERSPYACWQQKTDVIPSMQTPLKFDRVAVLGWSGNGTHTDSQLVMTQYVLYAGDNRGAYILLTNNADPALATNADVIGYISWSNSEVSFEVSDEEMGTNTHWFIYDDLQLIDSGVL
jgi:hypothetical protein